MKTAYINISPISVAYPNIIHLIQGARLSGAKRFFLCVWDAAAYEDPVFLARAQGRRNRGELVAENAGMLEKVLASQGCEVTTIYLSEGWARLFSKPLIARTFNTILSKTRLSDLQAKAGLPGEDLSLSRINYLIADALVATNLHKLFPEITATAPGLYVTSRRIAPFLSTIRTVLEESNSKERFPEPIWVAPMPFLVDAKGVLPSIDMNLQRVREVVKGAMKHHAFSPEEASHLYRLMGISPKKTRGRELEVSEEDGLVEETATTIHRWLQNIKQGIERPAAVESKTVRITNPDQFQRSVHPLSAIKLRILALCDGSRTSYTIAKELGIKQVTASVYLGRMRGLGLVSEERRPLRLVSNMVVDLEAMSLKGKETKR